MIIDASALLALLQEEPGSEMIEQALKEGSHQRGKPERSDWKAHPG